MISNGGLYALGWIIIVLIFSGISMLVHYENTQELIREAAALRQAISDCSRIRFDGD